jgi:hypothetical protein
VVPAADSTGSATDSTGRSPDGIDLGSQRIGGIGRRWRIGNREVETKLDRVVEEPDRSGRCRDRQEELATVVAVGGSEQFGSRCPSVGPHAYPTDRYRFATVGIGAHDPAS